MPILGTIASSKFTQTALSGFVALDSYTFPNSSLTTMTFSNIPQGYKHLFIIYQARGTVNDGTRMRFNGDSGASSYESIYGINSAGTNGSTSTFISGVDNAMVDVFSLLGGGYSAPNATAGIAFINDYTSTSKFKTVSAHQSNLNSGDEGSVALYTAMWQNTAAITSLTIVARTQNFVAGSKVALYGIN